MKSRMKPGCNPCEPGCLEFSDSFNRANESISTVDSTGQWTASGVGWGIDNSELKVTTSGIGDYLIELNYNPITRQFIADFKVKIEDIGSATFDYFWQHAGSEGRALRVIFQVTSTFSGDCGVVQVSFVEFTGNNETSNTTIGSSVKIRGLTTDVWCDVRVCYSAERGMVSVLTTPTGYDEQSLHRFYETPSGASLDYTRLRLKIIGSGITVRFDDFQLFRGYTEGDLGFGDAEDCPCCYTGCDGAGDDFEDGVIDCRWDPMGSNWVEENGYIRTTDTIGVEMIWKGEHPNYGIGCEPDNSIRVALSYLTTGGAGFPLIFLNWQDATHYYVVWINPSNGDAVLFKDGTTTILTIPGSGALLEDTVYTFAVCKYNGIFWLRWQGTTDSVESEEYEGDDSWGIGTAFNGTAIRFLGVTATRNIFSTGCADCFSDTLDPGAGLGCSSCLNDDAPNALLATVKSVGGSEHADNKCDPSILSPCYNEAGVGCELQSDDQGCSKANGSWILERSGNNTCACTWTTPNFSDVRAGIGCTGINCGFPSDLFDDEKSWEHVVRRVYRICSGEEEYPLCRISYTLAQVDLRVIALDGGGYRRIWVAHLIRNIVCAEFTGTETQYCLDQISFLFANLKDFNTLEEAKEDCMNLGEEGVELTPCHPTNNNPNNPGTTNCYEEICMWGGNTDDPFDYCDSRVASVLIGNA